MPKDKMSREEAIIELKKALSEIINIPFVTPKAYLIASKALYSTKEIIEKEVWITNDGV